MDRKTFIKELQKRLKNNCEIKLSQKVLRQIVDEAIELGHQALIEGETIITANHCSVSKVWVKPTRKRHPKTGKMIDIEGYWSLKINVSEHLLRQLNKEH